MAEVKKLNEAAAKKAETKTAEPKAAGSKKYRTAVCCYYKGTFYYAGSIIEAAGNVPDYFTEVK